MSLGEETFPEKLESQGVMAEILEDSSFLKDPTIYKDFYDMLVKPN